MQARHLGTLIKNTLEENGMMLQEFAERMYLTVDETHALLDQKDISVFQLQRASEILKTDLFDYVSTNRTIMNFSIAIPGDKARQAIDLHNEIEKLVERYGFKLD
ncbi:hypothetical protein [Solitalea canadensis]|uniref:HTH cro/C1-type domain-containing protein n=1 Tax=Solitalea canadensis (strain ATCC 29591 / DSM 3403 / JCM 21819 / LMG 8368 / NBRC 15130 / NCIMB 12057 / USAM 9D) TaxID=929556 RepID=H8KPU8_SOLCM|nr:hypothetical protein [Solitalea canadensis]AFD05996.1 hypothetical protein Solca_0881 [Solitalea canadensis DSM 3403]